MNDGNENTDTFTESIIEACEIISTSSSESNIIIKYILLTMEMLTANLFCPFSFVLISTYLLIHCTDQYRFLHHLKKT